jgi:hypothetical protein
VRSNALFQGGQFAEQLLLCRIALELPGGDQSFIQFVG